MSGQNLRDICVVTVFVSSLMVMLLPMLSTAIPLQLNERKHLPWATPCNPNGYAFSENSKDQSYLTEYIVEKSEEAYYHAEFIEQIMTTRFNDPQIIEYLRRKQVEGFPKPEAPETEHVNATKLLTENYNQLSKAAVFLEYIYENEVDNQVKSELEILFFGHLSQMCEIQLLFVNIGQSLEFPIADRSIISKRDHHAKSLFERYMNDIVIILKYKELLNYHMSVYQKQLYF